MDNTKLKSRLATKAQALQEAPAESEQDSLVPAQSGYAALNGSTLDLIRENLKEQPLTYQMFDMVKSPSGGSTVFTVPGLAGDEAEAVPAAAGQRAAPVGSGSSDQQGTVPQVCGPAHQLTDPTERRGHPHHPAESHQPWGQALRYLPL